MMGGKGVWIGIVIVSLMLAGITGTALAGTGSCEFVNFPYNSQGEVDWPYIVKVLRQGAPVYQDAGSSSVISKLDFSQSLNITNVQGDRVEIKQIVTGQILGWADKTDLLCALMPLKGQSGLEQKFFIRTATEVRGDKPATVKAYPSSRLDDCYGECRELSRFTGYFVFDVDERSHSYLLGEDYKIDDPTRLVGWVSGEQGFVWDTAYGVRPKEDLKFEAGHEHAGEERAVCAYQDQQEAVTDPLGRCLPILGGERWYQSDQRIPLLERTSQQGQEFYKVVLPLAGTGARYEKEGGKITIIEPGQFTENPGIESLFNMRRIDVLFLIDGTKSLRNHIAEIRGEQSAKQEGIVQQIIETLKKDEAFLEAQFRFGFRIYRDAYAGQQELGQGLPLSSQCELTHEARERNLQEFRALIDQVKVELPGEDKDDYAENLLGGIEQALKDLAPCPEHTKLLFIIGDCGYDAHAQKNRGRTPVEMSVLTHKLQGGNGIKNIVTFFIQTPKDMAAAKSPAEYENAYTLFTTQARDMLRQILPPQRSAEVPNYLLVSSAADLNAKILDGVKQFSNTQAINEIVLDLRGGAALKDAIERLKGSAEYRNIPGLFWDLIEQGSCRKLGVQCQERISDTIIDGYIPVSEDLVEDIWLKSDDLDKFTGLLREFDPDKLAGLPGAQLRETFVHTMAKSLENVIRKPVYEETGEPMREYLKRKGGLPVSDTSPLFGYSIDDLNDALSVPECELIRLVSWVNSSKRMLNILYHGDLRPSYKTGFSGECPSGEHIPYIDGDVQQVPLGPSSEYRYDHSFQKARVYWVPKEFLP